MSHNFLAFKRPCISSVIYSYHKEILLSMYEIPVRQC